MKNIYFCLTQQEIQKREKIWNAIEKGLEGRTETPPEPIKAVLSAINLKKVFPILKSQKPSEISNLMKCPTRSQQVWAKIENGLYGLKRPSKLKKHPEKPYVVAEIGYNEYYRQKEEQDELGSSSENIKKK